MSKKIISLFLSAILVLTVSLVMIIPAYADTEYKNISKYSDFDLNEAGLDYVAMLDLMSGYEDGSFRPDNTITRAEFAKSLVIEYEDAFDEMDKEDIYFSDVTPQHWSYDYIAKAVKIGFISGYDDGTFRPDDTITYEQAVTMIFNMLGYAPVCEMYGGFPHAYMALGYYHQFFQTVDGRLYFIEMNEQKEKNAVTRRDAAYMIQKALFIPLCEVTDYIAAGEGGLEPVYTIGGTGEVEDTLFSQKHVTLITE